MLNRVEGRVQSRTQTHRDFSKKDAPERGKGYESIQNRVDLSAIRTLSDKIDDAWMPSLNEVLHESWLVR